ncbi:MAG: hypothetical protein JWO37_1532 [Acidimicrobiales bacterium]|jgi:Flp pilus assembly protein TadG|nr:hypothetical protein [Acidimicrobiales bacterium]
MTRGTIIGRADRNESGVALVEFAFVLVLFVMLLWGIISFGYAWSLKEQMQHGAQEGIRSALVATASAGDDTAKQTAAVDSARAKLQSMLGADSAEPTATPAGGLEIITSNYSVVAGKPVYQPCKTTAGTDEPNTKCMTITLTYYWANKPKIAPLPGIFAFLPSTIHTTVTGKIS